MRRDQSLSIAPAPAPAREPHQGAFSLVHRHRAAAKLGGDLLLAERQMMLRKSPICGSDVSASRPVRIVLLMVLILAAPAATS
jgi:hypothetical protein